MGSNGIFSCANCPSGQYSYEGGLNADVPKYECLECPFDG